LPGRMLRLEPRIAPIAAFTDVGRQLAPTVTGVREMVMRARAIHAAHRVKPLARVEPFHVHGARMTAQNEANGDVVIPSHKPRLALTR
jgi:hypothetical protein